MAVRDFATPPASPMTLGGDAAAVSLTTTGDITAGDDLTVTDDAAVGGVLTVGEPTRFEYRLASVSTIDVGSATAQTLYTVPTGFSCIITRIVFRGASGTFNQAQDPIFSIGWNSTDYNDVVGSATYTNAMAAALNYFILVPDGKTNSTVAKGGAAGDVLKINVTQAATASTTVTVSVFGYLF